MLDETTCPVCGKGLDDDVASDWVEYGSVGTQDGRILSNSIWAVAHYLAHLVQQKHNVALPDGNYDVHGGIAIQRLDRTVGSP